MDISSLQAFIAVARDQSFSKASERLFITQPAVSKRVASLESELGVELFNRVARTVSLTEAGKQLLSRARDLVNQAEELQRYASNLNDDISGNLSISISHHIGLHRMPPVLREFNRRYPRVDLDIRFEDSDQAFNSVEQGDIEFGVITLPRIMPEKISGQTVWVDDLNVVVASDHELAQEADVSIDTLAAHPCVLPSRNTETYQIMARQFDLAGLQMSPQMETNNLETLKMLVAAGIGWSVLPSTMLSTTPGHVERGIASATNKLDDHPADNTRASNVDSDLLAIDIKLALTRNLGMVFHARRSLSNAAHALKTLIVEAA